MLHILVQNSTSSYVDIMHSVTFPGSCPNCPDNFPLETPLCGLQIKVPSLFTVFNTSARYHIAHLLLMAIDVNISSSTPYNANGDLLAFPATFATQRSARLTDPICIFFHLAHYVLLGRGFNVNTGSPLKNINVHGSGCVCGGVRYGQRLGLGWRPPCLSHIIRNSVVS